MTLAKFSDFSNLYVDGKNSWAVIIHDGLAVCRDVNQKKWESCMQEKGISEYSALYQWIKKIIMIQQRRCLFS